MNAMAEPEVAAMHRTMATWIYFGMSVLSARLLLLLTVLLTFSLFAWSAYKESYQSLWVAGVFGVLVFIPVLSMDRKLKAERSIIAPGGGNA